MENKRPYRGSYRDGRVSKESQDRVEKGLCIQCKERPIRIKKRSLCTLCYGRLQRGSPSRQLKDFDSQFIAHTVEKKQHQGEIEFIKNFFSHNNWIYQPTLFRLDGVNYSPDFYDSERNVFIEISATRQAYHFNKNKYDRFRKIFPKLNFEIRKPSGELLNEDIRAKEWEQ